MPQSAWSIRSPGIFPARFATVVLEAESSGEPTFFSSHRTSYESRRAADKFREWRFCLRESKNPAHRGYRTEIESRICLRSISNPLGGFDLYVEIRPRVRAGLSMLNPDLADILSDPS